MKRIKEAITSTLRRLFITNPPPAAVQAGLRDLDWRKRMQLTCQARRAAYRHWDARIAASSIPVAILIPLGLIWVLPPNHWIIALGAASEIITLLAWRLIIESHTWAALAREFPHLCKTCGYNLCASPCCCPECGSPPT